MARIISIVNQKGGTGKSACTANLAVGLAQKNKKVLIVDADPQSDVSAGFGYRDCDDSNETLPCYCRKIFENRLGNAWEVITLSSHLPFMKC